MGLADRVAVMQEGRIVQYARPMDIYQQPASTFVAGFIGNPPMNLLKAARQADRTVKLGNWPFTAPGDGDILLGVRAEDLDVVEPGAAIDATVRVVEPLGPSQLVTVDIDGQMARVDVANQRRVMPGEKLGLKPKDSTLRWFAAEGGARLG
jgi:multiple sugar transport system ATP-binding protein